MTEHQDLKFDKIKANKASSKATRCAIIFSVCQVFFNIFVCVCASLSLRKGRRAASTPYSQAPCLGSCHSSLHALIVNWWCACVFVCIHICARVNVWSNCVIKTGEFEVQEETSGNLRRLRFNVSEVAQTTEEEISLDHKSSQWQSWSWERNIQKSYHHKSLDLYTVDKKTCQTFGPEILD